MPAVRILRPLQPAPPLVDAVGVFFRVNQRQRRHGRGRGQRRGREPTLPMTGGSALIKQRAAGRLMRFSNVSNKHQSGRLNITPAE